MLAPSTISAGPLTLMSPFTPPSTRKAPSPLILPVMREEGPTTLPSELCLIIAIRRATLAPAGPKPQTRKKSRHTHACEARKTPRFVGLFRSASGERGEDLLGARHRAQEPDRVPAALLGGRKVTGPTRERVREEH